MTTSHKGPRLYGAHVSVAGGIHHALETAKAHGMTAIQVHPTPPQKWNTKLSAPGHETQYLEILPSSGVQAVFFHGIYLINLANPDPQKQHLARLSLINDLELAHRCKAQGVIFHLGSLSAEPDRAVGFRRVTENLNRILEEAPGEVPLVLEVSAGAGSVIGSKVQDLAEAAAGVKNTNRIRYALDTQHLWASGYDLASARESLLAELTEYLGLEKIVCIHLNDSKSACGSKIDRHDDLGVGLIGAETLQRFIFDDRLAHVPLVMETPSLKDPEGIAGEMATPRRWVQGHS